ncbi:MAG: DUF29 domain-containing protein [Alphaproteobacteria bacterium]|nr:DUF29 domain-containing protein [Alphaproteobacteria bacterium]
MDRRLYDDDFYLWTQAQAEALRAEGSRVGGSNAIDWGLVAEEVEDLGISERNRAFSLTTQVLVHFYKLAWSERLEPRGHWEAEILAFRGDLKRTLTGSIRRKIEDALGDLHLEAAERAERQFKTEETSSPTDLSLRWTFAQVMGEKDDPIR